MSSTIGGRRNAFIYKILPPFFHEVWTGSFLETYVPDLRATDGEEMIATTGALVLHDSRVARDATGAAAPCPAI